jgi:hypothetical protein
MKKILAKIFYWLASRLDNRFPRYYNAIKKDIMIYGTGFAKRINPEDIYLDATKKDVPPNL